MITQSQYENLLKSPEVVKSLLRIQKTNIEDKPIEIKRKIWSMAQKFEGDKIEFSKALSTLADFNSLWNT